ARIRNEIERRALEDELRAMAVERVDRRSPASPRLIADDATPEAVGRLLAEQHGRLGVFSSEGGPFAILAGRYSDGRVNCELFCKAHSGDAYDLDRIGRPSIHLAAPLLTIGLTVQPSVIAGLASTPAFRTLGLLARFLYALPRSRVGGRQANPLPVTDAVRDEYGRVVRAVAQIAEEFDTRGELVARPIPLSDPARRRLIDFKAEIEPHLGPGGDLQAMADWGNKLPGLVARLAGILHVGDHAADAVKIPIENEVMGRALAIGRYAVEHARVAFGLMGADPATTLAKHIWAWCRRSDAGPITRHTIHRALQARVQCAAELDAAIAVLVERSLLREVHDAGPRRRGRPSSPVFELNPRSRQ
ncbi:MAG: YfjI family protein, partial [Polyangiaceae bacterium]